MSLMSDSLLPLTALVLHRLTHGPLHLLITSAWPGEGKSTVAWTLGHSIADLKSKSTLLVDGDLRKPTLSYRMDLRKEGVAELTSRPGEIAPTQLDESLFGLGAGHAKGEVTEVIHALQAGRRLIPILQQYDFALIDSPPLAACEDAFDLAEMCTGVVIVVSAHKYRGPESLCLERFRERNIPLVGAVLTHCEGKRSRLGEVLSWLGLRS